MGKIKGRRQRGNRYNPMGVESAPSNEVEDNPSGTTTKAGLRNLVEKGPAKAYLLYSNILEKYASLAAGISSVEDDDIGVPASSLGNRPRNLAFEPCQEGETLMESAEQLNQGLRQKRNALGLNEEWDDLIDDDDAVPMDNLSDIFQDQSHESYKEETIPIAPVLKGKKETKIKKNKELSVGKKKKSLSKKTYKTGKSKLNVSFQGNNSFKKNRKKFSLNRSAGLKQRKEKANLPTLNRSAVSKRRAKNKELKELKQPKQTLDTKRQDNSQGNQKKSLLNRSTRLKRRLENKELKESKELKQTLDTKRQDNLQGNEKKTSLNRSARLKQRLENKKLKELKELKQTLDTKRQDNFQGNKNESSLNRPARLRQGIEKVKPQTLDGSTKLKQRIANTKPQEVNNMKQNLNPNVQDDLQMAVSNAIMEMENPITIGEKVKLRSRCQIARSSAIVAEKSKPTKHTKKDIEKANLTKSKCETVKGLGSRSKNNDVGDQLRSSEMKVQIPVNEGNNRIPSDADIELLHYNKNDGKSQSSESNSLVHIAPLHDKGDTGQFQSNDINDQLHIEGNDHLQININNDEVLTNDDNDVLHSNEDNAHLHDNLLHAQGSTPVKGCSVHLKRMIYQVNDINQEKKQLPNRKGKSNRDGHKEIIKQNKTNELRAYKATLYCERIRNKFKRELTTANKRFCHQRTTLIGVTYLQKVFMKTYESYTSIEDFKKIVKFANEKDLEKLLMIKSNNEPLKEKQICNNEYENLVQNISILNNPKNKGDDVVENSNDIKNKLLEIQSDGKKAPGDFQLVKDAISSDSVLPEALPEALDQMEVHIQENISGNIITNSSLPNEGQYLPERELDLNHMDVNNQEEYAPPVNEQLNEIQCLPESEYDLDHMDVNNQEEQVPAVNEQPISQLNKAQKFKSSLKEIQERKKCNTVIELKTSKNIILDSKERNSDSKIKIINVSEKEIICQNKMLDNVDINSKTKANKVKDMHHKQDETHESNSEVNLQCVDEIKNKNKNILNNESVYEDITKKKEESNIVSCKQSESDPKPNANIGEITQDQLTLRALNSDVNTKDKVRNESISCNTIVEKDKTAKSLDNENEDVNKDGSTQEMVNKEAIKSIQLHRKNKKNNVKRSESKVIEPGANEDISKENMNKIFCNAAKDKKNNTYVCKDKDFEENIENNRKEGKRSSRRVNKHQFEVENLTKESMALETEVSKQLNDNKRNNKENHTKESMAVETQICKQLNDNKENNNKENPNLENEICKKRAQNSEYSRMLPTKENTSEMDSSKKTDKAENKTAENQNLRNENLKKKNKKSKNERILKSVENTFETDASKSTNNKAENDYHENMSLQNENFERKKEELLTKKAESTKLIKKAKSKEVENVENASDLNIDIELKERDMNILFSLQYDTRNNKCDTEHVSCKESTLKSRNEVNKKILNKNKKDLANKNDKDRDNTKASQRKCNEDNNIEDENLNIVNLNKNIKIKMSNQVNVQKNKKDNHYIEKKRNEKEKGSDSDNLKLRFRRQKKINYYEGHDDISCESDNSEASWKDSKENISNDSGSLAWNENFNKSKKKPGDIDAACLYRKVNSIIDDKDRSGDTLIKKKKLRLKHYVTPPKTLHKTKEKKGKSESLSSSCGTNNCSESLIRNESSNNKNLDSVIQSCDTSLSPKKSGLQKNMPDVGSHILDHTAVNKSSKTTNSQTEKNQNVNSTDNYLNVNPVQVSNTNVDGSDSYNKDKINSDNSERSIDKKNKSTADSSIGKTITDVKKNTSDSFKTKKKKLKLAYSVTPTVTSKKNHKNNFDFKSSSSSLPPSSSSSSGSKNPVLNISEKESCSRELMTNNSHKSNGEQLTKNLSTDSSSNIPEMQHISNNTNNTKIRNELITFGGSEGVCGTLINGSDIGQKNYSKNVEVLRDLGTLEKSESTNDKVKDSNSKITYHKDKNHVNSKKLFENKNHSKDRDLYNVDNDYSRSRDENNPQIRSTPINSYERSAEQTEDPINIAKNHLGENILKSDTNKEMEKKALESRVTERDSQENCVDLRNILLKEKVSGNNVISLPKKSSPKKSAKLSQFIKPLHFQNNITKRKMSCKGSLKLDGKLLSEDAIIAGIDPQKRRRKQKDHMIFDSTHKYYTEGKAAFCSISELRKKNREHFGIIPNKSASQVDKGIKEISAIEAETTEKIPKQIAANSKLIDGIGGGLDIETTEKLPAIRENEEETFQTVFKEKEITKRVDISKCSTSSDEDATATLLSTLKPIVSSHSYPSITSMATAVRTQSQSSVPEITKDFSTSSCIKNSVSGIIRSKNFYELDDSDEEDAATLMSDYMNNSNKTCSSGVSVPPPKRPRIDSKSSESGFESGYTNSSSLQSSGCMTGLTQHISHFNRYQAAEKCSTAYRKATSFKKPRLKISKPR